MRLLGDQDIAPPRSGQDIKRFRLDVRAMGLNEMAKDMKINPATLAKVEADENVWIKTRKAIAEYFDQQPEFDGQTITILTIWPELLEDEAA